MDETAHLAAGLSHWKLGRFEPYAVNPPLVRLVATLPVSILPVQTDWSDYSDVVAQRSEFPMGRQLIKSNGAWSMTLYSMARFALLPFAILGMLLVWRWSTVVTSATAGVIAVALYCCSPTVLANGSMITPDLGSAVSVAGRGGPCEHG